MREMARAGREDVPVWGEEGREGERRTEVIKEGDGRWLWSRGPNEPMIRPN